MNKSIVDFETQRKVNFEMISWFNSQTEEWKREFWSSPFETARKAAEPVPAANAQKKAVVENQNTMTRADFDRMAKENPKQAMEFCLNNGQIV